MHHSALFSLKHLANYLRCTETFLHKAVSEEFNIIETDDIMTADFDLINVHRFHIKKKSRKGGFRTVHEVYSGQLQATLKILNNYLVELYEPLDCVQGFVSGRNTKTNAEKHLSKKVVVSVDIDSFFDSISIEMIKNSLESLGFQPEIANMISILTTVNGKLAQGFNTSPTIANIVFREADQDIIKFCGNSVTYTRYADDLYFSSNNDKVEIDSIRKIIESHGFNINEAKTAIMWRGNSQYVTGLTVFDNKRPRIPKKIKKNLRLEIHKIHKYGFKKHAEHKLTKTGNLFTNQDRRFIIEEEIQKTRDRLYGWIHYIYSIEPTAANKLFVELKKCRR